jgi:hypothetical protein
MRGTEMQLEKNAGQPVAMTAQLWRPRAIRLLGALAMVTMLGPMLAACGRCGDFLSSSQTQIGACQKDPSPQH